MNASESNDVQRLLRWLLDPHQTGDDEAGARDAAQRLADRSHDRLAAGLRGRDVLSAWDDLLSTCPGCAACSSAPTADVPGTAGPNDRPTLRAGGFSVSAPTARETPQT